MPPQERRWTVSQFHKFADHGFFRGRRASLLNGVLIEEGSMTIAHRIAMELTDTALRSALGPGWRVCVQMPLVLDEMTDPEPDIAVMLGNPRESSEHPTTAVLVIEVADSSLRHDITTKAELYATGGVADYWVLDLDARQLHVFRDPEPLPEGLGATAYRTRLTLAPTDRVSPLAAPAASVLVSELLP